MAFPTFATENVPTEEVPAEEGSTEEVPEDIIIEIELPVVEPEKEEMEEMDKEEASNATPSGKMTEEELKTQFFDILTSMIDQRNEYVLNQDLDSLEQLYNTDIKASKYAFEHEAIKSKYLTSWAKKQGVTFKDVKSELKVRKVRDRDNGLYGMTCNICTSLTYAYDNAPDVETTFKIGTSHYIHLQKEGDKYIIVKEWYTDPLCDTLEISTDKPEEITQFFLNSKAPEFTPNETAQL